MQKKLSVVSVFLATVFVAVPLGAAQETGKEAKVLLAGTGTQPHTQNVMDGLTEYFESVGIFVRQVSMEGKSRTEIVEKMPEMGVGGLLLLSVHIEAGSLGDKGVLQCWNAQGKKVWEEEGGVGRFTMSASTAQKNIVNNLKKKLEKRPGDPCLPKK
jgi:hypothetical protein